MDLVRLFEKCLKNHRLGPFFRRNVPKACGVFPNRYLRQASRIT